jgi:lipase (class 3)
MRLLCIFAALLPLVAAEQFPILQADHDHPDRTVSAALFAELEELSRIVDIAYCVGLQGPGIQEPFECFSHCADFENFELVSTFNTGQLLSDSCGYIALSHPPSSPRLIVAFRGTYSLANTIADLSTIPQEYIPYPGGDDDEGHNEPKCKDCMIHMGWWTTWKNTRDVIIPVITKAMQQYPDYELTLVGHSLGGAIATLAGLELITKQLLPITTTFGEPRLGNQALADYIDMRFNISNSTVESHHHDRRVPQFRRVTHINDPIPFLPLEEWGYMPHAGEIFISKVDLPPKQEDIMHCIGQGDKECSQGVTTDKLRSFWHLPTRLKIWQIFFAHRDYFYRLGICIPQTKWVQGIDRINGH